MVQNPKGGGLSSSFGGGGQQMGGVQKTTDFLDRSTWILSTLLLILILLSNFGLETNSSNPPSDSKLIDESEIEIIPDRIEAITMIIAGIITQGELKIENINPSHIEEPIELIRQCGAILEISDQSLFVKGSDEILPISFETEPYPGIPTDIQAQLMVLNSIAKGDSKITETIFENRFMHILELKRMGANIGIDGNTAKISGVPRLNSAPVMATDLRASAALILAGLIAEGETIIDRIYHLDRGYESVEKKLSNVGAKVRRID